MNKIVCISRQFASGGHEIGRRLAEKYNIPIYDKELITQSMEKSGLDRKLIESNDENAQNSMIYSIAMGQITGFNTPYIAPPGDKVYYAQSEVIRELATQGACIMIGRCAGEILRSLPNCVRIFIYANNEFRALRAIQYYNCTSENVIDTIRRNDRKRSFHFNHYNTCKWGSIESFDFAIDTSKIGIEGAVQTIEAYLQNIGNN
ncbi:cytidylate kinase-like family protein [Agathobaculum sp. TL06]